MFFIIWIEIKQEFFFIYLFNMSENQNLKDKKEELLNDKKDLKKIDWVIDNFNESEDSDLNKYIANNYSEYFKSEDGSLRDNLEALNDIRDFLLDNIAKLENEILVDESNNEKSNNGSNKDDSDDSDSGGSDITITPSKYARDLDREKMDIDKSSRSLNSKSLESENNYYDKLMYFFYIVIDSIQMLLDYSLDFFNNFL